MPQTRPDLRKGDQSQTGMATRIITKQTVDRLYSIISTCSYRADAYYQLYGEAERPTRLFLQRQAPYERVIIMPC